MPARITDQDDHDLDFSEVRCPRCGCNHVTVLKAPRPNTWFGAIGKGRCEFCRAEFALMIARDDQR
jgi:hypothetical protein